MSDTILVEKPNQQTVHFSGKFINLSEIARSTGLHPSYISRIFQGERTGTVRNVRKISAVLNMTVEEFMTAMEAGSQTKNAV